MHNIDVDMAKKSESKQQQKNQKELPKEGRETNHVVLGLSLTLAGTIAAGGLFNGAGVVGFAAKQALWGALGVGSVLAPIGLITSGILVMRKRRINATIKEWVSLTLAMVAVLGLAGLYNPAWGGFVGAGIATGAAMFFDTTFAFLVLSILCVGSFIFFFEFLNNIRLIVICA